MEQQQFEELLKRLDILIKISIINAFQDKSRTDVIRILSDSGFTNPDIASILGTSYAFVANVRSELKKERAKAKLNTKKTTKKTKEIASP
jgi:hypothetical protein